MDIRLKPDSTRIRTPRGSVKPDSADTGLTHCGDGDDAIRQFVNSSIRQFVNSSIGSLYNPSPDAEEVRVGEATAIQCCLGAAETFGRHGAGLLEAIQRRVGRFPCGGVLARCLAEMSRFAFDIENVIDNLER